MERTDANQDAQDHETRRAPETYHPFWAAAHRQTTQHKADGGTVEFWKYMKALYKDDE